AFQMKVPDSQKEYRQHKRPKHRANQENCSRNFHFVMPAIIEQLKPPAQGEGPNSKLLFVSVARSFAAFDNFGGIAVLRFCSEYEASFIFRRGRDSMSVQERHR